jgi:hypothetical protein
MRQWISRSLLIGGVFLLVWLVVIYSWRTSNRLPSSIEVGAYFLGFPLLVLGTLWLGRKVLQTSATGSVGQANSETAKSANNSSNAPSRESIAQEFAMLASSVKTCHGMTGAEVLGKLQSGEARLELDENLADEDGFPIPSGRIASLTLDESSSEFLTWHRTGKKPDIHWLMEDLRAISLGSESLREMLDEAHGCVADLEDYSKPSLEGQHANSQAQLKNILDPIVLEIFLRVPERFSNLQSIACGEWYRKIALDTAWPSENLRIQTIKKSHVQAQFEFLSKQFIEQQNLQKNSLILVLAFESMIGDESIDTMQKTGVLVNGKNPNGIVPSEGAAGLLVMKKSDALALGMKAAAYLKGVSQNKREQSIKKDRHAKDGLLRELTLHTMTSLNIRNEDIKNIISDTGSQVNQTLELVNLGTNLFPDLDLAADLVKLTEACGDLGGVASLATLALGFEQARVEASGVMCASNLDEYQRSIAFIFPASA